MPTFIIYYPKELVTRVDIGLACVTQLVGDYKYKYKQLSGGTYVAVPVTEPVKQLALFCLTAMAEEYKCEQCLERLSRPLLIHFNFSEKKHKRVKRVVVVVVVVAVF
ncbi:hypothetical protein ElyMa_001922700 [Elysia marginata]|uniref:Uncharacterized protein n=1 Tax=Elysia marginata TaxID=1093978 RepID=A0AAV4ETU5_9GAST|nr:hypothetical protein ElyMa_001922700 [Elysia marginata]